VGIAPHDGSTAGAHTVLWPRFVGDSKLGGPTTTMTDDPAKYSVSIGAAGDFGATLKVAPEETDSGVAVVEHTLAPGTLGAPLHRHSNEDEISHVLEGELTAKQGEAITTAAPGEFVVKPRGVWHTFWNAGDEPLRFTETIAPGAFAAYFAELAELMPEGEPPGEETMGEVGALAAEYDLEMDPSSVPDLLERHGLRL
jgi:quercetin dioxygenase-like cupin family protein